MPSYCCAGHTYFSLCDDSPQQAPSEYKGAPCIAQNSRAEVIRRWFDSQSDLRDFTVLHNTTGSCHSNAEQSLLPSSC